jgi:2-methylisocitrate lyase-like PEP mutase family enzyme
VSELAAMGVRRISVGASLSRVALGAFLEAAKEIREKGTFTLTRRAIPMAEAKDLVSGRRKG